jgi:hypothetical protein
MPAAIQSGAMSLFVRTELRPTDKQMEAPRLADISELKPELQCLSGNPRLNWFDLKARSANGLTPTGAQCGASSAYLLVLLTVLPFEIEPSPSVRKPNLK